MTYHGADDFKIQSPLKMAHIVAAASRASKVDHRSLFNGWRRHHYKWRAATWFVIHEYMPNITRSRAAKFMGRDHTTLLHHDRQRARDPARYESEVNAIKRELSKLGNRT